MRAEFVDQTDAALAVAERDEVLAEQSDAHRRTIRLGDFPRQAGRNPIPPHRISHWRAESDAGDQFVFLRWQHRRFPPGFVRREVRITTREYATSAQNSRFLR